jgi:hypothetical protein
MALTISTLKKIINEFAKEGKIFSNEAQFQFELAWALKEMGYDVQLEVLSGKINNEIESIEDKMYTDIVVTDKDKKELYAIELKYKTAAPSNGKFIRYSCDGKPDLYTFSQGAYDFGSYDFLKDVERIEKLVLNRNDKIPFNFGFGNKEIAKGFAIILTNEWLYWKDRETTDQVYKDFYILDNNTKSGTLGQVDDSRGERKDQIYLKGNYKITWDNYILSEYKYKKKKRQRKEYDFKYLILEVSNNN